MVMRIVMVIVLLLVLTGCLKKAADENASMEPSAAGETAAVETSDVTQGTQTAQGKSVSVEPAVTQAPSLEKPSAQDIQEALKGAGLYEGKIDGILGPNTRKAIEDFQSQNSLKPDGKVGPKTWEKLGTYLAQTPSTAAAPVTDQGSSLGE